MTAQDHIVAWIESSATHYANLLELTRRRQGNCRDGYMSQTGAASAAAVLATIAYNEMLRTGDALRDDPYSAGEILRAAVALAEWELQA